MSMAGGSVQTRHVKHLDKQKLPW